jgi:uncharacterized protein YjbI with pentapeptide repeats
MATWRLFLMHWFKRDLWKAGIAIAGMLLLLVLLVEVPVSAAGAQERGSGLAGQGTITMQAMPTEDATVTALNKEKLAQEVQQLQNQNEPDPLGWLRGNASILLSTLVVVFGGLFGLWRWRVDRRDAQDKELKDRKAEREKQAEERFQSVVDGLGSTSTTTQIGAAIMLHTFLRPGYEQFYSQVFDLAVAYLRLRNTGSEPEPPDSLNQALITVFKGSFPFARDLSKQSQSLDALGVQLDRAYLARSDLRGARMPESYLRKAKLYDARLKAINLRDANLSGADLRGADLREATLRRANLSGADLRSLTMESTPTSSTGLGRANLSGADLRRANLSGADLSRANLSKADLSGATVEDILSLKDTNLRGVKGLTKEQLEACKAKGAIIDEDSPVRFSQSPVSPPPPEPGDDTPAPSAPPARGSPLTPDTGGGRSPTPPSQ